MGRYLMQRGGVYTYRRVVVSALRPFFRCSEIWKSLGTDKRRACIAARRMAADFDQIAQLAQGGLLSTKDNRDVFRKLAQDYRREHGLDHWEVSAADQQYVDDLVRRYAQERLDWLDTARARGYSYRDVIFAFPDKPKILPLVDPITKLDLSKGHFPENRGGAVSADARDTLIAAYEEMLHRYDEELSLQIISPLLGAHANRVLDFCDDHKVTRYTAFLDEDEGTVNQDPVPPLFRAFALTLLKAEVACCQEELRSLSERQPFSLQRTLGTNPEAVPVAPERPPTSLKISGAIDKWVDWYRDRGTVKDATLEEYEQAVRLFPQIVGDKPISAATPQDVEHYLAVLRAMPRHVTKSKAFAGKTPAEAAKIAARTGAETLSYKAVTKKFDRIKHFLAWAFKRKFISEDIGAGIDNPKSREQRLASVAEERDAFDRDGIEAIAKGLAAERAKGTFRRRPARYWLPLLGLFTGCRAEELAQLHVSDISQDDTGLWCLRVDARDENGDVVKQLKTAHAKRVIPLHKDLLALGFLTYYERVKSKGWVRMWPELKGGSRSKYHRSVTEWFNSTGRKSGLLRLYFTPEKAKRLSFHSLRHSFASGLKTAGVSEVVTSELSGHAHGSLAYDRYGKALPALVRAREGIDLLNYRVDFVNILGSGGAGAM